MDKESMFTLDENGTRALPIGVENFEKMITKNYYYVDKTLMIKELLDKLGDVNLFTRPRRFGKSLNISMLQYFFDNQLVDKKDIFNGLKIMDAGDEYLIHQNAYPLIRMSFKDVMGRSFEKSFNLFKIEIAREYDRHKYLLGSAELADHEKRLYSQFLTKEGANEEDYQESLKFLSTCLQKHHDRKVIILIDEYDVPLEKAHFTGYYEEMVELIRSFFSMALKTNDSLEFSVITGCLRVSKESIFTGFNNPKIISILSDNYGEYFGFLQNEVDKMLAYYDLSHMRDDMRDWYNGYLFGETVVYNPWSAINHLSDLLYGGTKLASPHWSNTSSNTIVRDLITHADDESKDEIEALIRGESITKPVNEDIVYADILKNKDNLWNFLFFTGYLKKVSKKQIGVHNYLELNIPNKEIQYIYERQIREWFDERIQAADLTKLYRAVLEQDVAIFEDEIIDLLGSSISYMDSHENFYHGFLTGVLNGIKGYRIVSNRESGRGRGDLFITPRSTRKPAIIIEVKVSSHARDLEKDTDIALKQIETKKYADELEYEGYTQIIKYGIAFYRKDCRIKLAES